MSIHGGDDCRIVTVENETILSKTFDVDETDILWTSRPTALFEQVFTVSVDSQKTRDEQFWRNLKIEINAEK